MQKDAQGLYIYILYIYNRAARGWWRQTMQAATVPGQRHVSATSHSFTIEQLELLRKPLISNRQIHLEVGRALLSKASSAECERGQRACLDRV